MSIVRGILAFTYQEIDTDFDMKLEIWSIVDQLIPTPSFDLNYDLFVFF